MTDNGKDSVSSIEPIDRELDTESKEPPKTFGPWHFHSAADTLNAEYPEIPWLINKIIPLGGLAMLSARPKIGKSTLARCLAVSVAQGLDWLGRETKQGCVLFFSLEEIKIMVDEHFPAVGARGKRTRCLFTTGGRRETQYQYFFKEAIKAHSPALVVVDPLVDMIPKVPDMNDYAAVNRAMRPFLDIVRETGSSMLLVHHSAKAANSQGREILGSTGFLGAVDVALLMDQDSRGRNLYTRPRYGEPLELTELRLDDSGWGSVLAVRLPS